MERFFYRLTAVVILFTAVSTPLSAQWQVLSSTTGNGAVKTLLCFNNVLYAGTQTGGLLVSTDNGTHWTAFTNGLSVLDINSIVAEDPDIDTNLLVGTNGGGFYFGSPYSWTKINTGLSSETVSLTSVAWYGKYALGAVSGEGIYRVTKDLVWHKVYSHSNVVSLYGEGNKIFAGLSTGGVVVSVDSGATWASSGLADKHINLVAYNVESDAFAGATDGFYYSSDAGSSWQVLNSGITTSTNITAMCGGGVGVFCGTDDGIVYVHDKTSIYDPWRNFNAGQNGKKIYSLAMSDSYVFAGTDNGVFRRSLDDITSVEQPTTAALKDFSLQQNYPNPFNPATTISYQLPTNSFVALTVYDILGKEVAVLVNGNEKAGEHSVQFNAANLSSGMYIYKLVSSNYSAVKKMMLMK